MDHLIRRLGRAHKDDTHNFMAQRVSKDEKARGVSYRAGRKEVAFGISGAETNFLSFFLFLFLFFFSSLPVISNGKHMEDGPLFMRLQSLFSIL